MEVIEWLDKEGSQITRRKIQQDEQGPDASLYKQAKELSDISSHSSLCPLTLTPFLFIFRAREMLVMQLASADEEFLDTLVDGEGGGLPKDIIAALRRVTIGNPAAFLLSPHLVLTAT